MMLLYTELDHYNWSALWAAPKDFPAFAIQDF